MPHATKPHATKRQEAVEPEALRLKYKHQESMWLLALATLVVVAGLAFMAFHIPSGAELVGTALGLIAGKELVVSRTRNKHP